ncbi:MAG TPA: DUF420 domain-containing protein [Bacillales bacterium]|nr:DUF420 domain-containing protein [Bacillales bacterium]
MALLPLISTGCIVVSAVLMAFGWSFIRRRKIETHRRFMLTASGFALAFFIIYMYRTIFIGNTSFGGPDRYLPYYTIFLVFHILLSTTGGVFGAVTLTLALKKNFVKHRKLGPWTATIWFFTALTGMIVYLLLYVFFPHGTTTSLFQAIFGTG